MIMYKLTGYNRGTTDVIGYYKEKNKADRVITNLINIYRDGIQTERIEVDVVRIPMYSPDHNITFVMRNILYRDESIMEEVIGWYHGEPDEDQTNKAEEYGLMAEYF